jgi:hypothetical protein
LLKWSFLDTSVKDGDAVQTELGQPDVDDDSSDALWNWDIYVSKNDHFNNTDYIGIEWNQKVSKYKDDPLPLGTGESWATPWGYVTLDFEVPEVDYKEYTFVMEKDYDINSTHEQDVLLITAVGQSSSNDGLDYEGQDTNRVAVNGSGAIWYEDTSGDFQIGAGTALAAGTTQGGTDTLSVEASSDTNKWIVFQIGDGDLAAVNGTSTAALMYIEDVESADENLYTGANISSNVSIANSRFGPNVEADDADDLNYNTVNTTLLGTTVKKIQSWDDGVLRTIYGTLITGAGGMDDGNLEAGIDNDEYSLWFPEDEVYAEVTFNVRSSGAAAEPVLTTESGASGYDKLILVGGPCVNSLTASYMGLTYPACEGASTITENKAVIKLVEKDSKTALIVAGWEKADTARAAGMLGSATGTSYIVE